MLQRLPGQLERHPLLRIDVVGLHLRQREELGVEALDVGQVAAAGAGLGDPLGDPRLVEELLPAALGQVGDRVAALEQRLPRLVGRVHVAGEPGGDADDRDVVDVARRATSPRRRRRRRSRARPRRSRVASDSMVGWRNATVAVSVTPVRSSMSLAIATASRDDRPSSTIGADSSIASADWPVALAIQLRSHVAHLGDGHVGAPACRRRRRLDRRRRALRVARVVSHVQSLVRPPCRPVRRSVQSVCVGEGVGDLAAAQAAVEVGGAAGAAADLAAGGARDRARRASAARRAR